MHMPKYDGLIERWKVGLIATRAKRMGFRRHEIPDILQEVVPELLKFKYDPNHANGAHERSALVPIIDNHLRKMIRSGQRYTAHLERLAELTMEGYDHIDARAMDVAEVVACLPEREQVICRLLAQGHTRNAIARQLGCGWHTVDRMIEQLRERFEKLELDGWLGK